MWTTNRVEISICDIILGLARPLVGKLLLSAIIGIDRKSLITFEQLELDGKQVLNSMSKLRAFFRQITLFPVCDVI